MILGEGGGVGGELVSTGMGEGWGLGGGGLSWGEFDVDGGPVVLSCRAKTLSCDGGGVMLWDSFFRQTHAQLLHVRDHFRMV